MPVFSPKVTSHITAFLHLGTLNSTLAVYSEAISTVKSSTKSTEMQKTAL